MNVNRRHKNIFLLGWKTTVTAVFAFLCLLPDQAVSQKADSNDETAGIESSSSIISLRSSIGQPLIGRMSGGSIRGFAGVLYRIAQPPRIESEPPTVVSEKSLYRYQISASDANGDSIIYSIVAGPTGMQLTAAGEILWTPTQNNVGSSDVVLAVYDARGDSSFQSWSIDVVNLNDAPVVSDIPDISFLEDSTFTIDLDAFVFDVDNDTSELSWTADIADGGSGTVLSIKSGNGGRNLKTAEPVTLSGNRKRAFIRGREKTNSAGLRNSISRANRNKRGTARNAVEFEQRVDKPAEDEEIIVEMRKITAMKSVITMSSLSGELLDSVIISIDSTSHIATFTATANYFAADIQIIFTATDPDGLSDSDSSLLTIEPVNDAPELSALPDIVFNEDETLVVNFAEWFDFVDDPDNPDSTLSWSVATTGSDSVNVIILGDSVLFTAPRDWFAFDRDTLIVTVADFALESSVRLAVHVLPINDAPSLDFIPDTLSFGNDTSLVMSFDSFEIDVDDPDSLLTWFAAFSDSSSDTLLFFDILGDSAIRISRVPGWVGEDTLTIVVEDTSGARDSTIVLIQVTAPVGIEDYTGLIPLQFEVFQNYPNPFNPTTTIRYALPKRSDVTIEIYNLMGQLVTRIHKEGVRAGYHEERWNGVNQRGVPIASGVYIYRLRAGEYVQTRKMLLLK